MSPTRETRNDSAGIVDDIDPWYIQQAGSDLEHHGGACSRQQQQFNKQLTNGYKS